MPLGYSFSLEFPIPRLIFQQDKAAETNGYNLLAEFKIEPAK